MGKKRRRLGKVTAMECRGQQLSWAQGDRRGEAPQRPGGLSVGEFTHSFLVKTLQDSEAVGKSKPRKEEVPRESVLIRVCGAFFLHIMML